MRHLYYSLFFLLGIAVAAQPAVSLVQDINDGTGNSSPANLYAFNGNVYFGADDSSGVNTGGSDVGRELWSTDGTAGGTQLVSDIHVGSSGSSPNFFFELNGELFFSANAGAGNQLFKTDGTAAGTTLVTSSFVFSPTPLNGLVYSVLTSSGNTLHQFNGTTNVPVAGSGNENVLGGNIVAFQDKIFASMGDSSNPSVGRELFAYDPTTSSFSLIKDIEPGTANSGISNFVVANAKLYFEALGELWESDGTNAGTIAVSSASGISGLRDLFVFNDNVYFEGDDGSDDQLWVYDTTAGTTTKLTSIAGGNNPSDYAELGGFLYYAGDNPAGTSTLFRTDGTVAGTEELDPVAIGFPDGISRVDDLEVLGTSLIFEAENLTNSLGRELYTLDPASLSVANLARDRSKVELYPTRVRDELFVKGWDNGNYQIFNTAGQQVANGRFDSGKAIILSLNAGVYFVRLNQGKNIYSQRILVTK